MTWQLQLDGYVDTSRQRRECEQDRDRERDRVHHRDETTIVIRECHGFVNPCGCNLWVSAGTGTGWDLVTQAEPMPVRRRVACKTLARFKIM